MRLGFVGGNGGHAHDNALRTNASQLSSVAQPSDPLSRLDCGTVLHGRSQTGGSSSQRIDQLIHLIDQILYLTLVVVAIGSLAKVTNAVGIGARLTHYIRDGAVEIVDR